MTVLYDVVAYIGKFINSMLFPLEQLCLHLSHLACKNFNVDETKVTSSYTGRRERERERQTDRDTERERERLTLHIYARFSFL